MGYDLLGSSRSYCLVWSLDLICWLRPFTLFSRSIMLWLLFLEPRSRSRRVCILLSLYYLRLSPISLYSTDEMEEFFLLTCAVRGFCTSRLYELFISQFQIISYFIIINQHQYYRAHPTHRGMEGIYLQYLAIQIQIKRERMTSSPFPLLKLEETQRNANSEYGISQAVQRSLANGNTQFVIDVARQMKISYSIPTIALQIVARFFHLRCYIHYDRFTIIIACLILAFKLRYLEFRFKDVVFAFHQVMCFRNKIFDPLYDESISKRLKEEINIAENQVLRTLEYQIDVTTPHDYLAQIILLSFPGQTKTQTTEKVKLTTRIIILDSNRAQTSLYFSPLTICIGALMIACRYLNVKPYALVGNTKASTEVSEKTEQQLYGEWLECICNNQKQKVKQQDVLECIKHMNKIVKIIAQP